jgi:hypothetical protein
VIVLVTEVAEMIFVHEALTLKVPLVKILKEEKVISPDAVVPETVPDMVPVGLTANETTYAPRAVSILVWS